MAKYKVTYFDFAGGRGEEVRLALTVAGVDFKDNRVDRETFLKLKPDLPVPTLPVLEVEGEGAIGESNAILRLIGRRHGMHPADPFDAARHDALMDFVEDLRHRINFTTQMQDPAAKKAARQKLAEDYIPQWSRCVERMLGDGPFMAGADPSVVDMKLFIVDKWLSSGTVDDIPSSIFDAFPKFKAAAEAVRTHPRVVAWYAR